MKSCNQTLLAREQRSAFAATSILTRLLLEQMCTDFWCNPLTKQNPLSLKNKHGSIRNKIKQIGGFDATKEVRCVKENVQLPSQDQSRNARFNATSTHHDR